MPKCSYHSSFSRIIEKLALAHILLDFGPPSFDIAHSFQVHAILSEIVMGGMVLETNMNEIVTRYIEQDKLEKSEVRMLVY